MAPRRAAAAKQAQPAQTSREPASIKDLDLDTWSSEIKQAVVDWETGGAAKLQESLSQAVSNTAGPAQLASLPLIYSIISIVQTTLSAAEIVEAINSTSEGLREDVQRHVLGEALVEAVEALEQRAEEVVEPTSTGTMEVDGETQALSAADKGIEVIQTLMKSSSLPSSIPNLVFSPERLLKLSIHPIPGKPEALHRAYIKRNTALYFKQVKYNLLREQSEGFSALVVLLTSPSSLYPDSALETAEARKRRSQNVWSRIQGLIGYFDLSPPRVLDLILEIVSAEVADHWHFFLDLLQCSPWGREAAAQGKGKARASEDQLEYEVEGIRHVLDADGNRVLAQVLGAKFGFHQKPDGGDTPSGLTYFAAILIKHGLVSLKHLLPFLSPNDAQMIEVRDAWKQSMKPSGPANALSSSVLVDEDTPAASTSKAAETAAPPRPPSEQRIQLLQALLAIGDLHSAYYFLALCPWLAQSHPTTADLILRIVEHALEDVYQNSIPPLFASGESDDYQLEAPAVTTSLPLSDRPMISSTVVPLPPDTPQRRFRFFYEDWATDMERWTSISDILEKGLKWFRLIRGLGGRRVDVMAKLCRIGVAEFARYQKLKETQLKLSKESCTREERRLLQPTADEMKPWLIVLRSILLPALSASSTAFDVELWQLLDYLPYSARYSLYGEWRDRTCNASNFYACPVAARASAEHSASVRKALQRVTSSKNATSADRGPARMLAKLSHHNPIAVWTSAVNQVKAYENIGPAIVEAGRYMSRMSMDVATFIILGEFANDYSFKLNDKASETTTWYRNLSVFIGDFNRRYAQMDIEPLLQFMINRFARKKTDDLTILEEVVKAMSGVEQVRNENISQDQLRAYASGKEMLKEAFHTTYISIPKPPAPAGPGQTIAVAKEAPPPMLKSKLVRNSLPKLVNSLRVTHFVMPFWIALAQIRQGIVDAMPGYSPKQIFMMHENVNDAFVQYGTLITENMTPAEHIALIPSLRELVAEYGLDFSTAFQILRPKINAELEKTRQERKAAMALKIAAAKEEGIKIASPTMDVSPLPSPTLSTSDLPPQNGGDVAMNGDGSSTVPRPKTTSSNARQYPSALRSTMLEARDLLPVEGRDLMCAPFFVIFWHLVTSDIGFSAESYDQAVKVITAQDREVAGWRGGDKSAQDAERDRLKARIDVLKKEKVSHEVVVKTNRKRLQRESKDWFGTFIYENSLTRKLSQVLQQYCFWPRAILSANDAMFVARFIRLAHDIGTVGFSTIFVYGNFFTDSMAAEIFSCTSSQARNLGRCLGAMMADIDAWHKDEKVYRREALGIANNGDEGLPGMLVKTKSNVNLVHMPWSSFRNFYAKCHHALTSALVSCLASTDFAHIKNAITIALHVTKSYPMMESDGQELQDAFQALVDRASFKTDFGDLHMQTSTYLVALKQRRKSKAYVAPHLFHPAGPKPVQPEAPPAAPTPAVGTPKANGEAKGMETPVAAPAATTADPKALRAKLEESRSRQASLKANKEEDKTPTPQVEPVRAVTPPLEEAPAADTSTRDTESGDVKPAPTGPASTRPAIGSSNSMGPPTTLSNEAERNAARARRFGLLTQQTPPSGPAATTVKTESPAKPAPTPSEPLADAQTESRSRRSSPATRSTRRSPSAESKTSERSRRDRRERDGRDRERDRGSRPPRAELLPSKTEENGARSRTPSDRKSSVAAEGDRKKDEPKSATTDESEHRRSSRGGRDEERRSDRDRERDRDRDKKDDRDRSDRGGAKVNENGKRRREDEAPRRIDEPRDARNRHSRRDDRREDRSRRDGREPRRDDRRDDDRERDQERERRRHRGTDRPDRADRPERADRADRNERDRRDPARDRRDSRDEHDAARKDDRGKRDAVEDSPRDKRARTVGTDDKNASRTPKADPPAPAPAASATSAPSGPAGPVPRAAAPTQSSARELLPSKPAEKERIVEAPRPTNVNGSGRHALPARPGQGARNSRPPTPPRDDRSLADRITPSRPDTPVGNAAKRTIDQANEASVPAREESPGAAKRVRINRTKARDHDRKGREEAAGNRMLADAVRDTQK